MLNKLVQLSGRWLDTYADKVKSLRGGWRIGGAIFAGAAGALALAPVYALPLLAVSLTTLIFLLDAASHAKKPLLSAFWTGWAFGLGYFVAGIYWMAFSFFVQAEEFAWLSPLAVLGLPSFLGLFTGAACVCAVRFWRPGWRRIVLFAAVWAIFEYVRGHVLTGLPWNLTGQALAGSALLGQSAAWYGAYGLSLVAIMLGAAPAAWAGARLPARRVLLGPVITVLGLCGLIVFGALRLQAPDASAPTGKFVRIVQPNIPQREKIDPSLWRRNFDRQLTMSAAGLPSNGDVFIIWPENAAPLINEARAPLYDMGAALPANATVLLGAVRREVDASGDVRFYNSLAVAPQTPNGREIVAFYDKHHLVPFGEYLPFRGVLDLLGLSQLAPYEDGFTPGAGPSVLSTAGSIFSPLICYEVIFPGRMYPKGNRPEWLLTVTNDAWFGDTSGPRQHLDQARLRSIETGLPMIRSANTGISAVIDSKGRILNRAPLYSAGVIDSALPAPLGSTLYARVGDMLFLLMVVVFLTISVECRHCARSARQ